MNPVTNVRAFGDDPERVARLATAVIRGLQRDDLMAATAKHFPGDGVDDRDQHICTSVNSFSLARWRKTYGKVWKRVIREDVMSIMAGHIALPCVDPGEGFVGGIPRHCGQGRHAVAQHCLAGTVRMVGHLAFQFWNSVMPGARNLVITAFGNPYLSDEIPF